MPKYKFVGDPRHGGDGPDVISMLGMTFVKDEAVEVGNKDIAAKLAANSHFVAAEASAKADDEMTVAEVLAGADDMHHKTLGAHARRLLGDDAPTTKAEIIEALEKVA